MSANKCAIVIVVNVITENLFYVYLYPAIVSDSIRYYFYVH